jgi:hypothetical protein
MYSGKSVTGFDSLKVSRSWKTKTNQNEELKNISKF